MSRPIFSLKKKRQAPAQNDVEVEIDPFQQLKSLMAPRDVSDRERNHIYFYGDVDQDTCLDLNRKINDLTKELLKHAIDYDCEPPNIYLHINSNGGCLLSAFSTVDVIKNSRVPIVSIVEGCAASAATIISMVCHKRFITPNSFMLIHQLSTGVYGKYEEIKDDFINDTAFMDRLYKLYQEHTSMDSKKLKAVLSRDIWWDMKECVANGLVDGAWDSNMTSLRIKNLFEEKDTKSSVPEQGNSKKRRTSKTF